MTSFFSSNEPLPDPNELSSERRVQILNQIRKEQLEGVEHPPHILEWALSLLRLERSAAISRKAPTTAKTGKAPELPTMSLDDLV